MFRREFRARAVLALMLAGALASCSKEAGMLPDPSRTPGFVNPDITQDNFHQKICVEGARQYRPLPSYTNGLKKKQLRDWHYADQDPRHYEEDHLIPISLGGHPHDPRNLWPEPWDGPWGAHTKDKLEYALYRAACAGEISLTEAQHAFQGDWTASYRHYEALIKRYHHHGEDAD